MQGIRVDMDVFLELLRTNMPALASHLTDMIPPELVVQSSLQTFFINSGCSIKTGGALPPTTILRFLDVIFLSSLSDDFTQPHEFLLCGQLALLSEFGPLLLE